MPTVSKTPIPDTVPQNETEALGTSSLDQAQRFLTPEGELLPDRRSPLDATDLVTAYWWMLFSRQLDERAVSLQRQGRIGTYSAVYGQEASVVGCAMALDPATDWIVPQYRETPALVRHGYPLARLLMYYIGNPLGALVPDGVRVLPIQISLAAQLPHAVGLAWGRKLQNQAEVVMTFCGDGASSEGDFHEACNFAGVMRAPVVFVLQNNGYAISTPRAKQSAAATFASRAQGYGIHGELVDGNDLLAVYDAAKRAVERARSGGGATLIESVTYRLYAHNTADDPTKYLPKGELDNRRLSDPLERIRMYLVAQGLLSDSDEETMREQISKQIGAAVEEAEAHPKPTARQMFDHVYARPPARVVNQQQVVEAMQEVTT